MRRLIQTMSYATPPSREGRIFRVSQLVNRHFNPSAFHLLEMQTLFAEVLLSVYVLAAVRILIQFRNCRQDAGGSQGAMINSSGLELSSPRCSCDVLRHYFRPSCHWTGKSGLDVLLSLITRILIYSHSTISTNAMHQTVTRIGWRNGSAKTYRRLSRSHRKIASE